MSFILVEFAIIPFLDKLNVKDHATVQRASLLMMKSVDVMTRLNVSLARVHHVHALVRSFVTSIMVLNMFFKGDWSEWTPCDGECGGGVRTRERNDPCIPDFVPELETEECVPISKSSDEIETIRCIVEPATINPKVLRAKVKETKNSIATLLDKYW